MHRLFKYILLTIIILFTSFSIYLQYKCETYITMQKDKYNILSKERIKYRPVIFFYAKLFWMKNIHEYIAIYSIIYKNALILNNVLGVYKKNNIYSMYSYYSNEEIYQLLVKYRNDISMKE